MKGTFAFFGTAFVNNNNNNNNKEIKICYIKYEKKTYTYT